jgi:light-regulated signal transduction histidine kinase (bacteriophytochrome)
MQGNEKVTILVVDDDEGGRYIKARLLRREGYHVVEAATGEDGLRAAQEGVSLAILDVNLPDISGFEVCRRLRALPFTQALPVLQISASYLDPQARVSGLEAGADTYLTEPVEPEVLLATVRALLRIRRVTDTLMEEVELRRGVETELHREIAERTRVETQVRELNEELEQRVQERTAELMRSNAELKQFAYIASHDLQEPLRSVASFTQLLARRYRDKLDPEAMEFIRFATDGVHRMTALIDDLLTYSRLGDGHNRKLCKVSTEQVLQLACSNLRASIEESQALITHDPLPLVHGDQILLVQLFQNLLGNAIKYRSEAPPTIHFSSQAREAEWVICVQDNGIGIDPEYFEHVFGIFKRLHGKESPGTGIGLAICRKIVEHHYGEIWVESTPGEGSRFLFTLPQTARAQGLD